LSRKQIIKPHPATSVHAPGEIDIAAVAIVIVTSETPEHPVDHACDEHRGQGGTRWIAGEPGEQVMILALDTPQTIRHVSLEVQEPEVPRTQELQLSLSCDGGRTYRELSHEERGESVDPPPCGLTRIIRTHSSTRPQRAPAVGRGPLAWSAREPSPTPGV
jgi:hypothetical protein